MTAENLELVLQDWLHEINDTLNDPSPKRVALVAFHALLSSGTFNGTVEKRAQAALDAAIIFEAEWQHRNNVLAQAGIDESEGTSNAVSPDTDSRPGGHSRHPDPDWQVGGSRHQPTVEDS